MSDGGLTRIRNRELGDRRRFIAYLAGVSVVGIVTVVALVVAIDIIARLAD